MSTINDILASAAADAADEFARPLEYRTAAGEIIAVDLGTFRESTQPIERAEPDASLRARTAVARVPVAQLAQPALGDVVVTEEDWPVVSWRPAGGGTYWRLECRRGEPTIKGRTAARLRR